MKNLSLANCLVKVPAKKIALKSDFLENRKYDKYDPRILPGPPTLD